MRTLSEWLTWIETLNPRKIDLALDRVRTVAERMGLSRPDFPIITVAGTNGKGSTVAMLEGALAAAGYRVGAYTSPHLLSYNERVRIGGCNAGDQALCQAFEHIEAARGEIPLTYFEYGTLAALGLFAAQRLDAAVLEVGLGGRLDAVNAWDADVAVITAIGIDHVHWLGPDRESIGREKAGIMRADRPAVCSDPDPPGSIVRYAEQIGARLYRLGRDFSYEAAEHGWCWRRRDVVRAGLPLPAMRGRYQLQNAAGVLMALELIADRLPLAQAHIRRGLLDAVVPGRFQTLPGRPLRVLDVAHNPHAARALAETLRAQPVAGQTHAVFGMLRDKAIAEVVTAMQGVVHRWYCASLPPPRGATAEELLSALAAAGVSAPAAGFPGPVAAYAVARRAAGPEDRILVFGSFYTVGDIIRLEC